MNYNLVYKDHTLLALKHVFEAGFYSNCTIILCNIIKYYNEYKHCPTYIDTSLCFNLYKEQGIDNDIMKDFFSTDDNINIKIPYVIHCDDTIQFDVYKNISNIDDLLLFIQKYFLPAPVVLQYVKLFTEKYQIDYENTCVLFFRGNDKIIETILGDYDDFINRALSIYNKDSNIRFLIQSDETEFIEYCIDKLPNTIVMYDEIRHVNKCNDAQVDKRYIHMNNNKIYAKKFLAIIQIISKCKHIIMNSGNISLWIYLYRRLQNESNLHNIEQFLLKEWY